MPLTTEQRMKGAKWYALKILQRDIFAGRYTELQQLHESLNFKDNRPLINKLSEERNIAAFFPKMIYSDIALIVGENIETRSETNELFHTLYAKRFSHTEKLFCEIETNFKQTGSICISRNINPNLDDLDYLHYLIYASPTFDDPEKHFQILNYHEDMKAMYYACYLTDKNYFDDQMVFDGEKTKVFESKFFDRYVAKRREELAEYIGVSERNLNEHIHEMMKSSSEDGKAPFKYGVNGIIDTFVKDIIANQNGGVSWWNNMTTTSNKIITDGVKYKPDVGFLIRSYYKAIVADRYYSKMREKKSFTKITLARECVTASIENDFRIILCMYDMDVLYKMFSIMLEQYYRDFSWEKITNQVITQRYENIVQNLEQLLNEKDNTLKTLARKNDNLNVQLTVQESKNTSPFVTENNKLLKQLEQKDEEIERLKQKLQWQEEFISELSKPEEIYQDNIYDIAELQKYRFLFVGNLDAFPEIRHSFPNSIFMEMKTTNIDGIKVDAVVMLIKYMSHAMFYKVKAANSLQQIPNIMCNSKSITGILQEIYNAVEK